VSSLALQVLRALEEQLIRGATHNLIARTRPDVAQYVLNQKRAHLRALEERFAITLTVLADATVAAPQAFVIDRGEQVHTIEAAKAIAERVQPVAAPLEEEDDLEDFAATEEEGEGAEAAAPAMVPELGQHAEHGEPAEHGDGGRRRRRRRRRGRGGGNGDFHAPQRDEFQPQQHEHVPITGSGDEFAAAPDRAAPAEDELAEQPAEFAPREQGEHGEPQRNGERRRRRGRRGGRRNRHRNGDNGHEGHEGYDRGQPPQHEFAPAEGMTEPLATEPELSEAVADLDAAPPAASPAPVAAPPQPSEPEPARRRSTVREPAPIGGGEATAAPTPPAVPTPEPVITDVGATPDAERPRKTGWWSRRFAGG
jgi:ribonuclease E